MPDTARLKKKAAEFEAKRQYDRAIAVYEQIVAESSGSPRETDVPIYNRLGDLHLRVGNTDQAVVLYEKAVDLYAELGFFNNAIALCNKILRQAPNRSSVYYKLGKISAKKGFNSDAKQNFLEYAARMQRAGKLDEAFRALKEFADLCPGQDDVRLMLAEQLTRVGRKTEALEQLQTLHEQLDAEGRSAEAAAAVERIRAINPTAEPRRASGPRAQRGDDLIFLDLTEDSSVAAVGVATAQPLDGLEPTSLAPEPPLPMPVRPLTPQEFAVVELPPPAEEQPMANMPALSGLPLLDTESPVTESALPAAAQGAEEIVYVPPVAGFEPTIVESEAPARAAAPPGASQITPPAGAPRVPPTKPVIPGPHPPASSAATPAARPAPVADGDFIDLGEWLRADEVPRSTRMTTDAGEIPPEGEQADFAEMLAKFKQALAQNVEAEDYGSHYDLGIAFKEMGLLDEAIAEFQKALRGPEHRVATYEALGQCFVEKEQYEVAISLLQRAIRDAGFEDEQGLGVLYLLGFANEALGRHPEAAGYYQRVLAVDITFRDVAERLTAVKQGAR